MTVPEYVYAEGRKLGCTKEALCALLANLQAESAFISNNVEDAFGVSDDDYTRSVDNGTISAQTFAYDGHGYGLAQWTFGTRKQMMLNYAKSRGKSIGDMKMQVEFLYYEMKTVFGGIWNMMLTSTDLKGCTDKLLEVWENPLVKDYANRRNMANEWYKKVDSLEAASKSTVKETKTGMTKQEAINKVLNLAREEIGYHEKASNSQLNDKTANSGGANWTKYAEYLDSYAGFYNGPKNGYAWCDVFVDFLFVYCFGITVGREMICQPLNSAGAGCLYSAQYYKSAGCWHTNSPQPGDQIFFTYSAGEYSHTGIVEQVNGDTVTTIEGNTTDQVGRRNYNIGNPVIAGYGRPRWELAANATSSGVQTQQQTSTSQVQPVQTLIKKGAKGAKVKELQENLLKLGYDLGKWGADGDFGNDTFEAVKKFQKDHNLEVDGIVGNDTREAIEKALQSKSKAASTAKTNKFNVGDVVMFNGDKRYIESKSDRSFKARPGKAKITNINNSDGVKHPYHVVRVAKGGSNVFGWVDEKDIEAIPNE